MEFRTKIWVGFVYGGWSLDFTKKLTFPFAPFYNLKIQDNNGDNENTIELVNNEYCSTSIYFNFNDSTFDVFIRNKWRHPVSDEEIDDTISIFKNTGWKRTDTTRISELKELMKRDHERNHRIT